MTTSGEKVAHFEREFAKYHDCAHAVMVNSGSSANLLMIAALVYSGRLPRGSKVAVPAVSWSTTYAPLEQFGMKIVLVDVDDTMNLDAAQIPYIGKAYSRSDMSELWEQGVDAVFGVNLLGNPMDFDKLPDVLLIEDNCESLGAEYKGKKTGTFGVMGSHSLFFSHHISTMEGGVITTDDEELWRLLLQLRAHGWTRDLPEWEDDGFSSAFEFTVPGYSVRATEVQAVIGLEQLKKLPGFIEQRRKNGEVYKEIFPLNGNRGGLIATQRETGDSSWFGFAFIIRERAERLKEIAKEFQVRPIVAGNIARHPVAAYFDTIGNTSNSYLINADNIHDRGFFIGNNHSDARPALERMGELLA